MTTENKCPHCGKPVATDALMGLCPDCMLKAGVPTGGGAGFEPPTTAELGRFFPQLEILELIGKGGMGAVYKARQKELDRFVAVKILPPGVSDDPAFAERFAREAKALAKLNHPNIVTIHDFGQTDGLFYFVMEFVDGVNLRQLLNASRIEPREALAIVPQICDALQYAHDAGIVHRDIKPENILLDRRGRVKVADFGLAKLVGRAEPVAAGTAAATPTLTEAGKVVGTPQYMAPEQIERPSAVDHRADIYSLGVVFYQMLTGELPKGDFAPPSKKVVVDVRLDEVVLRALERKPELRYQQVGDVKTMIETIVTTPGGVKTEINSQKTESGLFGITRNSRGQLRIVLVGRRMGKAAIYWPNVPVAFAFFAALAMVGIWLYSVMTGQPVWRIENLLNPVMIATALVLACIITGKRTPVEKLTDLDAPQSRLFHRAADVRNDQSPLPVMDFWEALEAGDYARAWNKTAPYLQREFPQVAWVQDLEQRRRPLGLAVSREQLSTVWLSPQRRFEQTSLTTFATRQMAKETVVCAVQPDGEWRVEKYALGEPAPCVAAADSTASAEVPPPSSVDARLWAPFQSPLVREICAHMTEAEKREAGKRGMLFGLWNAATLFGPVFCVMFVPGWLGWVFGAAILVVGLSFYPLLLRMQKEQLCSTAWAKQQGITPDQIKRFANTGGTGWLRRSLLPDDTFAKWAQWICFALALFVLAAGIGALTRFELKPHELFFGAVLVVTLMFVIALAGLLIGTRRTQPPTPPATVAADSRKGDWWRVLLSVAVQVAAALPLLFFAMYIVPKFVTVAADLGTPLPRLTVLGVNVVRTFQQFGWLLPVFVAGAALLSWAMHHFGGRRWLWRWTAVVAAALFALFAATVAAVIIPIMMIAPQVIHRNPARTGASAAPVARSWHPHVTHGGNERGMVYVTHDNVDAIYVLYYPGEFGSSSSETFNPKLRSWHSKGTITLKNGKKFLYLREQESPDVLRLNGDEFNLNQGCVIVLRDDGSVEQLKMFPSLAIAMSPDELAPLITATRECTQAPVTVDKLRVQLANAEAQLNGLLKTHASSHPLVIEMQREIETLKTQITGANTSSATTNFSPASAHYNPAPAQATIIFDGQTIPLDDLVSKLKQRGATNTSPIRIRADPGVSYTTVANALERLKAFDYTNISIAATSNSAVTSSVSGYVISILADTNTSRAATNLPPGLVFGPVTNGLQVALELRPAGGVFTLGEPIEALFHIRNAFSNGVFVSGDSWRQSDKFTVEDEQGHQISVNDICHLGRSFIQRVYVKPGETAIFHSSSFEFLPEDADDRKVTSPVGHYAKVKPGNYTIRCYVHFPDLEKAHDPEAGINWRGVLETAPVTVDVKTSVAGAPAAPAAERSYSEPPPVPITVQSTGPSWFRLLLMGVAILGVAAVLLVFGIIRWKTGLGKTALIVAVLLPFVGLPGGWLLYRAAYVSKIKAQVEADETARETRSRQRPPPMSEQELVQRAVATIQDLADGKTADVVARFAPSLRTRWPEAQVQQWWQKVTDGQNKFLRVAGTPLAEPGHWNRRYVTVPCEFESSRCGIRISFFPDGDIDDIKLLWQGTDAQPVNPSPPVPVQGKTWTDRLESGATVELVGVSDHPSQRGWWRADGSPAKLEAFLLPGHKLPEQEQFLPRYFAVRLSKLPTETSRLVFDGDSDAGALGQCVGLDGSRSLRGGHWQLNEGLHRCAATIPREAKTVTLRAGLATGPWTPLAACGLDGKLRAVPGGPGVLPLAATVRTETNGTVTVSARYGVDSREVRVVALTDRGEREARTDGFSYTDDGSVKSATWKFEPLPVEFKEFQFQTRPYQWAVFRDVAVQPQGVVARQ